MSTMAMAKIDQTSRMFIEVHTISDGNSATQKNVTLAA